MPGKRLVGQQGCMAGLSVRLKSNGGRFRVVRMPLFKNLAHTQQQQSGKEKKQPSELSWFEDMISARF